MVLLGAAVLRGKLTASHSAGDWPAAHPARTRSAPVVTTAALGRARALGASDDLPGVRARTDSATVEGNCSVTAGAGVASIVAVGAATGAMAMGAAAGGVTAALWNQVMGSPHQPSKTLPSPTASTIAMLSSAIKRVGRAAFGPGALARTRLCATRGASLGTGRLPERAAGRSGFRGGANVIGGSIRHSGGLGGCGVAGVGVGRSGSGLATNFNPESSGLIMPLALDGSAAGAAAGVASAGASASPNVGQSWPGTARGALACVSGPGAGAASPKACAVSLGFGTVASAFAAAAAALSWLARFNASRRRLMLSSATTVAAPCLAPH